MATLPDVVVDLLEIATYVYCADQVVGRGGTSSFDYGVGWRRRFRFEIPVRCPDIWRRDDVTRQLAKTLQFLSDDESYEFGFCKYVNPPPIDQYLAGTSVPENVAVEEVMLFSGGLDSLGGAVQEILQGHRLVALISHVSTDKISPRQKQLVQAIGNLVPEKRNRPLHVQVTINKPKKLTKEYTQRTRSFLYASLAAVVATLFQKQRLRFYENGVTSLNLPLCAQVIGARASRTTHPKVLHDYTILFSRIFEKEMLVENPFQNKTKTDVLCQIKAAGHSHLIALSNSCMHTWQATTEHPHCGKCSQCVDRRLAALAAELDESEDPSRAYRSDVLTSENESPERATLLERYIGNVRTVANMTSPNEFIQMFSEVARVLRHVGGDPEEATKTMFQLHKRHADQICKALSAAIAQEAKTIVLSRYPPTCLLRLVCNGATGMRSQLIRTEPTSEEAKVVVDRESFAVKFGQRQCPLGNTKEFRFAERLHKSFGSYVSLQTLLDDVWDGDFRTKGAVQRTACNLRRRLKEEGLEAITIDGQQPAHYRMLVTPS